MSVTRYDVNGPSSVFEDVNGSLVDFKDYAALEDKRAALAAELKQSKIDADCYKKGMEASNTRLVQLGAENAGLNKFIAESCFVQSGEVPSWHQAIDHAPETPATDAFLAEVRASALPVEIAEIIDSGDLEAILFTSGHSETERYRMALYNFRTSRKGVQS